MWVDHEMLDVAFIFVCEGGLDCAFTEVGISSDCGGVCPRRR